MEIWGEIGDFVFEKRRKNEETLRKVGDTIQCTDMYNLGVPEERTERGAGAGNTDKEILTENFPSLMTDVNLHIQEGQ